MTGMTAGPDANYVSPGDDRIVAATTIVGGGEAASVSSWLSALAAGTDFVYICAFPGRWSVIKGTFTVEG